MHLAVNYHYVGMPKYPFAGIHGLDVDAFRSTILKLRDDFACVSLADVLSAAAGEAALPEQSCLVTFDDGMRCQYEQALPILDELNVPAAFFIMGAPYLEKRVPTVHLLHWSRAHLGDRRVLAEVEAWASSSDLPIHPRDVAIDEARKLNPYDEPEAARLKYFLTRTIDETMLQSILDYLFDTLEIERDAFIDAFFMSREMIRSLGQRGMIGSHALSHRRLASLEPGDVFSELSQTRAFLEDVTGCAIRALSYPYGIADSVDRTVAEQAAKAGYTVAYTMERAYNSNIDDSLLLARIDNRDITSIPTLEERSRYRV